MAFIRSLLRFFHRERWEAITWINLDTREIRETPRDGRGKFITSDRREVI